nr:MAG TPA: hypothetical protein [Caudoviricetes sp.]
MQRYNGFSIYANFLLNFLHLFCIYFIMFLSFNRLQG